MGQGSGADAAPVKNSTGAAPALGAPSVPGGGTPARPWWLGAAVIVWGLVSSMLLTLFVVPVLCRMFLKPAAELQEGPEAFV